MRAPVVIAVNGTATGAGFSLSLTGDVVPAAECAKFTVASTMAGLSPDGSSIYYLPRLAGLRRAQDLAFTNRTLTASEAVDRGLVTRVLPDGDLDADAGAICRKLADGPAGAQSMVKKLLLCSLRNGLEEQMELEGRAIADAAVSADGKEGISALVEKRKPRFWLTCAPIRDVHFASNIDERAKERGLESMPLREAGRGSGSIARRNSRHLDAPIRPKISHCCRSRTSSPRLDADLPLRAGGSGSSVEAKMREPQPPRLATSAP